MVRARRKNKTLAAVEKIAFASDQPDTHKYSKWHKEELNHSYVWTLSASSHKHRPAQSVPIESVLKTFGLVSTEASQISSTLSPDLHQVSITTSHALPCYLSHLSHLGAKAEQRETTFNSESGFYPNNPSAWFSTGTLGEHAAPQLSGLSAWTTAPYPSWWPDMEYSIFLSWHFEKKILMPRFI